MISLDGRYLFTRHVSGNLSVEAGHRPLSQDAWWCNKELTPISLGEPLTYQTTQGQRDGLSCGAHHLTQNSMVNRPQFEPSVLGGKGILGG
jgi:hypothetical protein